MRGGRDDLGTTVAQALTNFKRKWERTAKLNGESEILMECINAFARHDRAEGISQLSAVLHMLPHDHFQDTSQQVLSACTDALERYGEQHLEYLYLALHVLQTDWQN